MKSAQGKSAQEKAAQGKTAYRALRSLFAMLCGLCLILPLLACGEEEIPEGATPVYYLNTAETRTEVHYRVIEGETEMERIDGYLAALAEPPERFEYKAPLNLGFSVRGVWMDEGRLTLDLSPEYGALSATTEVLARAAIVRTLMQVDDVSSIAFTVAGEPATDAAGGTVGWMDADTFISNDGNEINTYEEVRIKLFFASEDGAHLISAYREKFYPTSMPIERFVVEELIAGPSGSIAGLYPTLNPETNVLSISTRDRVCYVNLDEDFLSPAGNVSTETAVYSIVNSLTDLANVDKVQILVDGEIPAVLSNAAYSASDEIVTTLEDLAAREQEEAGER